MHPVDQNGKFWPKEKSRFKLQEIKASVVAELNRGDVQRAKAFGVDLNVKEGALQTAVVQGDGKGGQRYAVDPRASMIKHSGADTQYEVRRRWVEFCSTPQDPDKVSIPAPAVERKEPAIEERLGGAMVATTPEPEPAPVPVEDSPPVAVADPPKRKRGRPRKNPGGAPPIEGT